MNPPMRSEVEVFEDLRALCTSPGYIHALAVLAVRENMIAYDGEMRLEKARRVESEKPQLIRTERSVLLGLMVTCDVDYGEPPPEHIEAYLRKTENLLEELHQILVVPMTAGLANIGKAPLVDPFDSGLTLREPIFYGTEGAHPFQYRAMAPRKYALDAEWLQQKRNWSVDVACSALAAIAQTIDAALTSALHDRETLSSSKLIAAMSFTAETIGQALNLSPTEIKKALEPFVLSPQDLNKNFKNIYDFNIANAKPILQQAQNTYTLLDHASLAEALYETPFFWMVADQKYAPIALANRGRFTERFCRERLARVFGDKNVHANVAIHTASGEHLSEIDVLVLYADRAIVVQAKSKRLTIEAKRGNDESIRRDFKHSVQDSYDQAVKCARALADQSMQFKNTDGSTLVLPKLSEIYVHCVVLDHYPALSLQARQFLNVQTTDGLQPPLIMDVFTLDVLAEFLETPLLYLSYANRRANYADRIVASHETTVLGFHLKNNLWLEEELNMLIVDDDFLDEMDLAMIVRREGLPGESTPDGILTRLRTTEVGHLLQQIEDAPHPSAINLGLMLLKLSEEATDRLSAQIQQVVNLARTDRKTHDLTIALGERDSGLTLHCNDDPQAMAQPRLQNHCEFAKYRSRANCWFGICVDTSRNIRFVGEIRRPWKHDAHLEAVVTQMPARRRQLESSVKAELKRNDACHCGSGKKFKKCCME